MKTININQLQSQISRVMKNVEAGEAYEVMRYSRPIAVIRPKKANVNEGSVRCDECLAKMDEVLKTLNNES